MTWTTDIHIGELRPWPESVDVVRGNETRRYVPEGVSFSVLMADRAAERTKLRELVADMWCEGMCECGSRGKCAECMYDYPTRIRELGIDVDG